MPPCASGKATLQQLIGLRPSLPRHAVSKALGSSPCMRLTDSRGLGVLIPPLRGLGPIARARTTAREQAYNDHAYVGYRLPHMVPPGKSITHVIAGVESIFLVYPLGGWAGITMGERDVVVGGTLCQREAILRLG